MMIRSLALLLPVTITPLLAVETVEAMMMRGPLGHVPMVAQTTSGTTGPQVIVPGSVLSADADAEASPIAFDLLHSLRF